MTHGPGAATLQLVGGPTALIDYGGLRALTDPTFDPPGAYESSGTPVVLTKLAGPAVAAVDIGRIDVVLISHDHHVDNLDAAGRELLPGAGRVLTTTAGAERLGEGAFADAGLSGRLRPIAPGKTIDLV